MLRPEEAQGTFPRDLPDGVDKEDSAPSSFGLLCPADDDAGFHWGVVEEVRPQAEHALE